MAGTVTIGCRLPNGLKLVHDSHLGKDGKPLPVFLKGQAQDDAFRRSKILILSGDNYGVTEVDKDFWDAWTKSHPKFPPLQQGAIFMAKDAREADRIASTLTSEKTGFEAMEKVAGGVKEVSDKE